MNMTNNLFRAREECRKFNKEENCISMISCENSCFLYIHFVRYYHHLNVTQSLDVFLFVSATTWNVYLREKEIFYGSLSPKKKLVLNYSTNAIFSLFFHKDGPHLMGVIYHRASSIIRTEKKKQNRTETSSLAIHLSVATADANALSV